MHRHRSYKAFVVPELLKTKRHFESINGESQDMDLVEEHFATTEIQARYYLKPEIQLIATLPYVQNSNRLNQEHLNDLQGLGDATAIGLYQVYNSMGDTARTFMHRWSAGGGVKLPTGKFQVTDASGEMIDEHLQPGTGSTDFILLSEYTARLGKFGASGSVSYKFNTANKHGFTFANRLNGLANLFYVQSIKGISVMPETGVYFERANEDRYHSDLVNNSGGNVFFSSVGGTVFLGAFAAYGKYQMPLSEHLNGVQLPNYQRIIAGVTMTLR